MAKKIADLYIGREAEDWLTRGMARERRGDSAWFERQDSVVRFIAARAAGKADAFGSPAGRWVDEAFGGFEISEGSDRHRPQLSWPSAPDLAAVLDPLGGDVYRLIFSDEHAWFDDGVVYLEDDGYGSPVLRLFIPGDDIFYDAINATRE